MERLVGDLREVGGVLDQVGVLDDRQRDAGHVGLLEGVGADQVAAHLPGDGDQRDRVQVGVGDAGDEVRRAGAAGRGADTDLAGGAGVPVGGVRGALLVAHEHMAQLLGVVEGVVERDGDPAGKAEDGIAALFLEGRDECLRASYLLVWCHCSTAPFSAPETSLT